MSDKLASYAVHEDQSKGRKFPERSHPYRSDLERDRDRVIHSQAFRRLEGKTQVVFSGIDAAPQANKTIFIDRDDSFRNRLTHSIEVSQIARTIAKNLQLNETLTEAICLAHDLGHPPFGHTGETILNDLMANSGGFEHNIQSLRIVELLEHPYTDFAGLNLMYETRLGLAKHKTLYDNPQFADFSEKSSPLEGQVADIADRIAYNCHDLEDGLRAGLITLERLSELELFRQAQEIIKTSTVKENSIRRTRTAKVIIDKLVSDCIETSRKNIDKANIKTISDVYERPANLITISKENNELLLELEKFLFENFYMHPKVTQAGQQIKSWIGEIFENICQRPQLMPMYYQNLIAENGVERTACDYMAGMTDRYCLKTLEKIRALDMS